MNIIFHHPLPLEPNAKSASGIRPLRMLTAFKELGHNVELVTGFSSERKQAISNIKAKISKGYRYDFIYSESSTMPTILTDPHHLPLHPLLDYHFFKFCNKKDIPIGLFYRDIYWLFDDYGKGLSPLKKVVAKFAYRFDLWVYRRTLDKLYLPSLEMGAYISRVSKDIMAPLPPGHAVKKVSATKRDNNKSDNLRLFYVGGMSNYYQFHKLFKVLTEMPQVELTVCTREAEWLASRDYYPEITPNIRIIHETGEAMEEYLKESDIAVLFVKPQEYRDFASPVKLYEYLGFNKPVLASEGTLAGKFVKDNQIGWTLPYEEEALTQLLKRLLVDSTELIQLKGNTASVARCHSWQSRARQVVQDLIH